MSFKNTLLAPLKPASIPTEAQWLSGEGAGSWFCIEMNPEGYQITRYNPEGVIECQGDFELKNENIFSFTKGYQFIHLSHCKTVNIRQDSITYTFERI